MVKVNSHQIKDSVKMFCIQHRQLLFYIFYGGLTTLVNILVYFLFARIFKVDYMISNVIAWIISVLFAFITNKLFVFNSYQKSLAVVIKEVIGFFGFRLLSGGIDIGLMYLLIDIIKTNDMFAKVTVNIIIVILNYLFGKILFSNNKV